VFLHKGRGNILWGIIDRGKILSIKDIKIGDVFQMNAGGSLTITSIEGSKKIGVVHNDDFRHEDTVELARVMRGSVKNPFTKSVLGLGYLGFGKYKTQVNKVVTISYAVWVAMLTRCYGAINNPKNIRYKDCTVCESWLDFQVFSEWYCGNESYGLGYELDKDLLVKGNKIYSSDTCTLIPHTINTVINVKSYKASGLPTGVCKHHSGAYESAVKFKGGVKYLGYFKDKDEAFLIYKKEKEIILKTLALEWKGKIEDKAFLALLNWEVDKF